MTALSITEHETCGKVVRVKLNKEWERNESKSMLLLLTADTSGGVAR